MIYDTAGLRRLPDDFSGNVRTGRHFTLINIEARGYITQAITVGEKEEMLANLEEHDLILMVWTGQYKSDVFALSHDDLRTHLTR